MSKTDKAFERLMSARSDASFSFDELCGLLEKLGYTSRQARGSHVIFQREGSFVNLQRSGGGRAKPYQVRQVREELKNLNLKP